MLQTAVISIPFGQNFIEKEIADFFQILESYSQALAKNSAYKVQIRDNKLFQGGRSIQLNGFTFTSQFISTTVESQRICFLSLAIYDIWFNTDNLSLDKNGFPAAYEIDKNQKKIRHYEPYFNTENQFVWVDEKTKTEELTTVDLANEWVNLLKKLA